MGGWKEAGDAGDCRSHVVDPETLGLHEGPREACVLGCGCAKVVRPMGLGIELSGFESRPCFQPWFAHL